MDKNTEKLVLEWILQEISKRNKDAEKDRAAHPKDEFKAGRALAYFEVMDIINSRISVGKDMSE